VNYFDIITYLYRKIMAVTACTSYNTTVVVGYVPGTGDTVGTIVTFNTPKPVWTESDGSSVALQCSAVSLGGFNGLNS
jgi:hypothetical protein